MSYHDFMLGGTCFIIGMAFGGIVHMIITDLVKRGKI
jgi:hypothetical protein